MVWPGFIALWLVLEVLGWQHWAPWRTLSEFVWGLEQGFEPVRFAVLFLLAVITTHLVTRWPS